MPTHLDRAGASEAKASANGVGSIGGGGGGDVGGGVAAAAAVTA